MSQLHSPSVVYEIQACLGEGHSSRVYRAIRRLKAVAESSELEQTVAIKILNSKNLVQFWRKEFLSLSRIRSAHCAQVYAFEWLDDAPALVMQYIDGVSLWDLSYRVLLSETDREEIVGQVGLGLKDLQEQELFHGDLSLNNIMIDVNGTAYLLDFGLANYDPNDGVFTTPFFMAPELLEGKPPSFASDVYSLGAIDLFLAGHIDFSNQQWSKEAQKYSSHQTYLSVYPDQRCIRPFKSCKKRRQQLGLKVQKVQTEMARLHQVTRKVAAPKPGSEGLGRRFFYPALKLVAVSVVFLAIVVSGPSSESQNYGISDIAQVEMRTMSWFKIQLNGEHIGYAPLARLVLPPGRHGLYWQAPNGQEGQRVLTLRPGEHIILNDSFFSVE